MQAALAKIRAGLRRCVLGHTAPYMTHATAMYEAFGFQPCARFRDPRTHTDLFMDKSIWSSSGCGKIDSQRSQ